MKKKKQLVVGIDIRDLQVSKTGQRTVIEELANQFRKSTDPEIRFVFFDTRLPVYAGRKKILILIEHMRLQFWKQLILPLKAWYHHCDIVFCGDYFVPYFHPGFKTIEIFHDAFFFEFPQHYNKIWLRIFHNIAVPAAKKCTYIMTVTDYARKKVQAYTHIPENKIVTIYLGPKSISYSDNEQLPDTITSQLHNQPYLLHVGVMEKRKNLPALLRAFSLLKQQYQSEIKLVLVGKGNGKLFSDDSAQVKQTIHELSLENEVILTGYLPDEQVAIVYKHASLLVLPSFNEGFGIPLLEAFKLGVPVVAAGNSCLPEVGGDAILTFDPFDEQDICTKIKMVLENDALKKDLIEKGHQRLKYFSWQKTAHQLISLFKKAAQEN